MKKTVLLSIGISVAVWLLAQSETTSAQSNLEINSLGIGTVASGTTGTITLQNGSSFANIGVNGSGGFLFQGEETVLTGPVGPPYGTLVIQPGSTSADPNGLLVLTSIGQNLLGCGTGIGTCQVAEALGGGGANFVTSLLLSGDFREEVNSFGTITTINAGGPTPSLATMLTLVPDVPTAQQIAFDGGAAGSSGQNSALLVENGNRQFTFGIEDEGRLLWGLTAYITSCSENGVLVTCKTGKAHNLKVGQVVDIQGVDPQGYCGTVIITAVSSSTTFSYVASNGLRSPSYTGGGIYDTDLYRSGAATLATDGGFKTGPVTFANLPPCVPNLEGTQRPVTDSTTNVWGEEIGGGGSTHVLAYCDGMNWTVIGL